MSPKEKQQNGVVKKAGGTFRLVSSSDAASITAGTIMFLPSRDAIPHGVFTDPSMNEGALNHPVVVVSCPPSLDMRHDSRVEIAIMTSFHGTTIKRHLAAKGTKISKGTEAARYSGYLRVVTASKPFAKDALKLKGGKGMKRDCSYINIKQTYQVEARSLALYGSKTDEVDTYRLTAHALRKVSEAVDKSRKKASKRVKLEAQSLESTRK